LNAGSNFLQIKLWVTTLNEVLNILKDEVAALHLRSTQPSIQIHQSNSGAKLNPRAHQQIGKNSKPNSNRIVPLVDELVSIEEEGDDDIIEVENTALTTITTTPIIIMEDEVIKHLIALIENLIDSLEVVVWDNLLD
jgi:hypothetical protein